jgi:POT family proton-dependent oligopeptide transporter
MGIGLVMLIISKPYFSWHKDISNTRWQQSKPLSQYSLSLALIAASVMLTEFILLHDYTGRLLILISIAGAMMLASIYKQANDQQKQALLRITFLTCFSTAFWIFDQQGSSSVALFISRYIDRHIFTILIPTGTYQAINPAIILVCGFIMANLWPIFRKKSIQAQTTTKLSLAMFLLACGFYFISYSALHAYHMNTMVSMWPTVIGLMLIGSAELFIDPVLLALITQAAPTNTESRLVALYYLSVGAIANYLAAKIAKFTIDPTQGIPNASSYHLAYLQIGEISFAMFVFLMIWPKLNDAIYSLGIWVFEK